MASKSKTHGLTVMGAAGWTGARWRTALALAAALTLGGCATGAVDERTAFWRTEAERHLPTGSTEQQAIEFFRARGMELVCCVSSPPQIDKAHYAIEKDVGHVLWTRYDIAVLVDFSPDKHVRNVRVQRWGVGL
jgi:hypothetical protein